MEKAKRQNKKQNKKQSSKPTAPSKGKKMVKPKRDWTPIIVACVNGLFLIVSACITIWAKNQGLM